MKTEMINTKEVPGLDDELLQVNKHIERLCTSNSPSMQKMIDWVLNARGKQIRPILTLLCSKLKNKKVDATEVAAVIEICHTASLVHDDIIDNADTRRGQLSVHKKFGPEMAVYCGDFMIFATLGRTELRLKPWYKDMFAKLEIMCDGEVGQFDNQYNTDINEEKYIENIIGKTSAMFSIACDAGAYEGKCSKDERKAVDNFARNFGLLFQMRDDLIDFVSTDELSLKTIHNDFGSGYYTLPAIHTFENPECGEELLSLAKKLKDGNRDESIDARISELIKKADGYRYTIARIEYYKEEAKKSLDCFGENIAKKKLLELVDILWESTLSLNIN